ncbi:extensin [Streptomyces sp. S465]|uniref:extensin n=1 Tax=Streptomyces sp. S465 TaxID=2979468 RepID=UPI0022A8AB7D|nr:extensin [Streptomyces sp. S465]WAP54050.1 extensin [Streptomyces sp. S465]
MGRHSRPTAAQQARATTLKAATALGVAGTIAIGLHVALGGDKSIEARAELSTQQDQAPAHIDPAVDPTPSQSHVSPSESGKPKPISDDTDATATPGGGATDGGDDGQRHTTPATPDANPSKDTPSEAAPAPAQRGDQVTEDPSAPSGTTPSAEPTIAPSEQPSQPSQTPEQSGEHGKGLVGGLVDGVGDTLGGVLGGLGNALGG